MENFADLLTDRTRLVAVTAASNLIGTRPALAEISRLVHDVGALFYVDGVHFTAHAPVDVTAIGADFYACSPYKFLGPHCGVLAGRVPVLEQLRPDKLLPSTDLVPERFELGTLPYELLAGTTAAVDFLASLGPDSLTDRRERLLAAMTLVEEHEDRLRVAIEDGLSALPGVTVRSRAKVRTPTLLLTFENRDPAEAYEYLAKLDINVPAGSFYAIEASRFLGLGDAGGLRVGLAPYSNRSDVDRLLAGLTEFLTGWQLASAASAGSGMSIDPTRIDIEFDPQRQHMVGVSAHGYQRFDVPFISEVLPDLWLGGCEDGLILPAFIKNLVSLYPWETYTVQHELHSSLEVRMLDSVDQAFDQVDHIAAWVNSCRETGPTLVHCQAGLNRSSLVVGRALMLGGMTADDAIALIRKKRSPACLSNPSFERWLRQQRLKKIFVRTKKITTNNTRLRTSPSSNVFEFVLGWIIVPSSRHIVRSEAGSFGLAGL